MIFLASCKTTPLLQSLPGQYYKNWKGYKYILILNNDSSFIYTEKYREGSPRCEGKWQFISKDTLLLKCGKATFTEALSSGYLAEREKKVIVVNKNKVMIDNVILKRKKK